MSHLINKIIQPTRSSIFMQQKRFRGKINIQKPKPPHHQRGIVEKFLTPFISNPDTFKPLKERCTNIDKSKIKKEKVVNPYEVILAREIRNWFDSSKMVGIFHTNSITAEEQFNFAVPLKRANMYLKGYQPSLMNLAFKGTNYEVLLSLIQRNQRMSLYVFSPETNAAKMFKISKKTPQVILIAGIIHGKLLNRNDFLKYGQMDLVTAQAGLVQVLRTAAGGNLNQQLTHHQSTLQQMLLKITTFNEV